LPSRRPPKARDTALTETMAREVHGATVGDGANRPLTDA
jgi:hypothetical protein